LQIEVLLYQQRRFFIAQIQFMFDDHRANDEPGIFAWSTTTGIHGLIKAYSQLIPWYNLAPFHPPVFRLKSTSEGEMKSFQIQLPVTFVPYNVQAF
jgi:hypothetical protein